MDTEHYTPNVVISDPGTRKIITTVFGILGIVLGGTIVLDGATDAFELSAWTTPATALLLFLSGSFGLSVTLPNTPSR